MVIEPGNNISSHSSAANKARTATPNKAEQAYANSGNASAKSKSSTADSVSLSSASRAIGRVEASLAELSDVDTAKVANIKAAVDSGTYRIDAEAIANKIQGEERLLG